MLRWQPATTRRPYAACLFNSFSSPLNVTAVTTLYSYILTTPLPLWVHLTLCINRLMRERDVSAYGQAGEW